MSPSQDSTRSLPLDSSVRPPGALLLVAGEGILSTFTLERDEITIGRAPDCDVQVEHVALSRKHALLRFGARITVEDLGSKNGTRLRGERLAPHSQAEIGVGESFLVGRFTFVIVRAQRSGEASTRLSDGALLVADPTLEGATGPIADLARSQLNALIVGETGVGKEVLAETLHQLSGRPGPLVRINCAALAPALIESELFGHEKGAFTGAGQRRPGLLEAAEKGTVFLDEIGELPEPAQAKLLRAIESREVTRVGGVQPVALDVRFLAATNRDLWGEVLGGRFRSDLYFRLNGLTLEIPPLRERRERIGTLARFFLEAAAARAGQTEPSLAPDVLALLCAHDWPGNVRELKAAIERAHLLARGAPVGVKHLSLGPRAAPTERPRAAEDAPPSLSANEAAERDRIVAALAECHGNQTRAAKLLGISRATLVNKLSIYRIPRPRK